MTSTVSRGPLTTRVLDELKDLSFPVGDNSAPTTPYGWQGEPNATGSSFIPWLSLTSLAAQPQRIPGALSDTGTEWIMPYTVFFAGLSRKQTDALADKTRENLVNMERELISTLTGDWRVMKVGCTAIGSANRVGSAYPDYYTQADTYEVWISKER